MKKRILTALVNHETNTFSRIPTDLDAFRARRYFEGDDIFPAFRGTNTEIAAFIDAAERYDWELVPTIAVQATPSGPVTADAYNHIARRLLAGFSDGPFDGVLLALHGAMVSDVNEDGEGYLLELIRNQVGPHIPVAATLDLHANVTVNMARHADILVSYKTYPHVDMYDVGMETAVLLQRTLNGEIRPSILLGKCEMMDGADHGRTPGGPMRQLLQMARNFEAEPGILSVSVNGGFPWADTLETGPSTLVVVDGERPSAHEIVQTMTGEIWNRRHELSIDLKTVSEVVTAIKEYPEDADPLVIAEFSDNPGGGGYGDATRLLKAVLDAGAEGLAFSLIVDPEAARIMKQAGIGAEITIDLGGRIDPAFGGPISVSGTVMALCDGDLVHEGPMHRGVAVNLGTSALLRSGGVDIVVTSRKVQVYDLQHFRFLGIEPTSYRVLLVKSAHHFRAAYEPIAGKVVTVDAGGLTSRNYQELTYRRVRRPVFPLDID